MRIKPGRFLLGCALKNLSQKKQLPTNSFQGQLAPQRGSPNSSAMKSPARSVPGRCCTRGWWPYPRKSSKWLTSFFGDLKSQKLTGHHWNLKFRVDQQLRVGVYPSIFGVLHCPFGGSSDVRPPSMVLIEILKLFQGWILTEQLFEVNKYKSSQSKFCDSNLCCDCCQNDAQLG